VLAADVEIAGVDGRHLAGWIDLLMPPGALGGARVAILFVDGSGVRKALMTSVGSIAPADVPFAGTGAAKLGALRAALGADALVAIEGDALPRLYAEIESSLRLDDDYAAQSVTMWRALKKLLGHGIFVEPRLLDILPVVGADSLQRTFDLLVPDGTSMLAYVIDDRRRECTASVIATKRGGSVVQVGMHLALEDAIGERAFARDWRSQIRRVNAVVEQRFAPPSIGVFVERSAYHRILTGPPDRLARELAARNVIIDPMPAWLGGLLGGAAAVAVATQTARALARFVPTSARRAAAGLAAAAGDRLKDSGVHPFSLLGFDPIGLWFRVRHIYRPRSEPKTD
jgi:hypothetical protein